MATRKAQKKLEELPSWDHEYLKAFKKKCVSAFDVYWVCDQLSQPKAIPYWYRSILTRMLVGWAIAPKDKGFRNALAWHHINDRFHRQAEDTRQAWKDPKNKAKLRGTRYSYYAAAGAGYIEGIYRYKYLYAPLGGFNSKRHESLKSIKATSSKLAKNAKSCLQLLDILHHLKKSTPDGSKSFNLDTAKKILQDINDQSQEGAANIFAKDSIYDGDLITEKNFDKLWKNAQPSAEFLAALYCILVDKSVINKEQKTGSAPDGLLNALDAIALMSIYKLPFHSEQFQRDFIGRAKYFSTLLRSRKKVSIKVRFPPHVEALDSKLNIFSDSILSELQNAKAGTKRMITSRNSR